MRFIPRGTGCVTLIALAFALTALALFGGTWLLPWIQVKRSSFTKAELVWDAAPDLSGVTGYAIYRDGQLVADVIDPWFTDTGLEPGRAYDYWIQPHNSQGVALDGADSIRIETPPALSIVDSERIMAITDYVSADDATDSSSLLSAVREGFSTLFGETNTEFDVLSEEITLQFVESELTDLQSDTEESLSYAEREAIRQEIRDIERDSFGGYHLSDVISREKLTQLGDRHWNAGKREAARILYEKTLEYMPEHDVSVFLTLTRLGYFKLQEIGTDSSRDEVADVLLDYQNTIWRFFEKTPDATGHLAANARVMVAMAYFKQFPFILDYDSYDDASFEAAITAVDLSLELDTGILSQRRKERISAWKLGMLNIFFEADTGESLAGMARLTNVSLSFLYPLDPIEDVRAFDVPPLGLSTPIYRGHSYDLSVTADSFAKEISTVNLTYGKRTVWPDGGIAGPITINIADSNAPHEHVFLRGFSDQDGDNLSDGLERATFGSDPNLIDSDGDGLSDYFELYIVLTDPTLIDSDGDGIPDGEEDHDGDGNNNFVAQLMDFQPFIVTSFRKTRWYWETPVGGGATAWHMAYRDGQPSVKLNERDFVDSGLSEGMTFAFQIFAETNQGLAFPLTDTIHVETLTKPPLTDTDAAEKIARVTDYVDPMTLKNGASPMLNSIRSGFSSLFGYDNTEFSLLREDIVLDFVDSEREGLFDTPEFLTFSEREALRQEIREIEENNFGGYSLSEVFTRAKLQELGDRHWIAGEREAARALYETSLEYGRGHEPFAFTTLFRLGYFKLDGVQSDSPRETIVSLLVENENIFRRFFDLFPDSKSNNAANAYSKAAMDYFKYFPALLTYDAYQTNVFNRATALIDAAVTVDTSEAFKKRQTRIHSWELGTVSVRFVSGYGGALGGDFHIQDLSDSFYFPLDPVHETRSFDVTASDYSVSVPVFKGHSYALSANINPLCGDSVNIYAPELDIRDGLKVTLTIDGDSEIIESGTNDPPEYILICDYMDSDQDGVSDKDESDIYQTDPNLSDSDGDGLSDYFEIYISRTDPLSMDSDGDGIPDGEEDPDGDGIVNRLEAIMGLNPLLAAYDAGGYAREDLILEDAEDGDTNGWVKVGTTTTSLTNERCPISNNPTNRVLVFDCNEKTTAGYRFELPVSRLKGNKFFWKMNFNDDYRIVFHCHTTKGYRDIIYTPSDESALGDLSEIHHGLSAASASGEWVTVLRDLQRDAWDAQENCDIFLAEYVTIYGDGKFDDFCLVMYQDNDIDLIPDEIELKNGLDPSDPTDAYEDIDGDGLTNFDEFSLYQTTINDIDTDDDGLRDGDEVLTYLTPPKDADADDDGLNDGYEIDAGMDPFLKAIQGNGYKFESSIQEDAEDGDTEGWRVYDTDPSGATITNETDPEDTNNRVIRFSGDGTANGYRYDFTEKQYYQFKISWRMKFNEAYTIYVSCQTNKGHRYAYYTASNSNNLGADGFVHHGLGAESKTGEWLTIHRDLVKDIQEAQPDCEINYVQAILIRGDGVIDDIHTYVYKDKDHDFLPDDLELLLGLDPTDPADALESLDEDSLSNVDEFLYYQTDLKNPDTDADEADDYVEVKLFLTDPLNPDTDSDYLTDGEELNAYHSNPLNPDTDADGLLDGYEVNFIGTSPILADTDSDNLNDYDEVKVYHTNPLKPDSDGDALTDGDEINIYQTDPLKFDSDGDGMNDGYEVSHAMNPNKKGVDIDGYMAEFTVWEDAEDMSVDSWRIVDNEPSGAITVNDIDPDDAGIRRKREGVQGDVMGVFLYFSVSRLHYFYSKRVILCSRSIVSCLMDRILH